MESLGIDIKLLVAQLINFALFFYIFKKFMAQPFSKFLKSEINKEKEKERILDDLKKKEEEMTLQEKKLKEKVEKEYQAALKKSKQEIAKLKEEMMAQAKIQADEIIKKAKDQIKEERAIMEKEIKEKITDLSLLIVEKALREFLTPEVQKKITGNILKNFAKKIN